MLKRIIHYIKVLPLWIKSRIQKIIQAIIWNCSKVITALFCCVNVFWGKTCSLRTPQNLAFFYPNKGKKCDEYGYLYSNTTLDLSIIIPVYNVEDFIDECLNSILLQKTVYSYEVIIVDDGSTDTTYEHLKKYLIHNNVTVFRQANAGQSAARNFAIDHSKGQYLMFVDGDDVLLDGAINSLMDAACKNNCKIAEGRVVNFSDIISDEQVKDSEGKQDVVLDYKIEPYKFLPFNSYSVAKVIDRSLWKKIRYPEGYIFEDVIIKFIVRRNAGRVAYIKDVVYGYRHHSASSTRNGNQLKKLDSVWVLPHILDLCESNCAAYDDVFYMLCLEHMGILNYVMSTYQSEEVQKACFNEVISQVKSVSKYKTSKMPLFFKVLEKAILDEDFEKWRLTAGAIVKYNMLLKWRENN